MLDPESTGSDPYRGSLVRETSPHWEKGNEKKVMLITVLFSAGSLWSRKNGPQTAIVLWDIRASSKISVTLDAKFQITEKCVG